VAWLSRIELRAAGVVSEASCLGDFRDRLRSALAEDLDAGAAGLKSIIAYRSGLAVAPIDEVAAAAAFGRLRAAAEVGGTVRLEEAAICDVVLADAYGVARERGVPMQLHSGYGDRDIDLRLGNPLHFRYALESGLAAGVPTVFLHCAYPYTRETAVLCANHRDVYLDIATCIPPIGTAEIVAAYRIALAICPITPAASLDDWIRGHSAMRWPSATGSAT
jgi:predicted TIM-barrel fold metal-dependent hydrolase